MYCFEDFHPKANGYIRKLIDNNNTANKWYSEVQV